jgi:hypothetical protein
MEPNGVKPYFLTLFVPSGIKLLCTFAALCSPHTIC